MYVYWTKEGLLTQLWSCNQISKISWSFLESGTVPKMQAALPRCMMIPIDWKRYEVHLLSPVISPILDPSSLKKSKAIGALEPIVSQATGMTMWLLESAL